MTEVAISLYLAGFCGAYALVEIATLFATVPVFWRLVAAAVWPAMVLVIVLAVLMIVILASVRAAVAARTGDDGWLQ